MSYRALPTRVVTLIVQAALLLAGGMPALVTGGPHSAGASGPLTRSRAATLPATGVLASPSPLHMGLVATTPEASWIPNGQVNALASDGTNIYLAGTFTTLINPATGVSQSHVGLARIKISTGIADAAWNPAVDGTPEALAYNASNSAVYVGGLFTTVNASSRTNLAAVSTATGATVPGFAPDPTNPADPPHGDVRALLVDQGELVVAGSFTQIAGASQKNLAKVDLTSGAVDSGFAPAVNAGVFAVNRPQGSNLLAIGGAFDHLGGNVHTYLGLVNATTGATNAWTPASLCPPTATCPVLSIASSRTMLFVAAGGPGGQAIGFDLASGARLWQVTADGNTQAIASLGTEVYVGGHFNPTFGTAQRQTLAAVDARTGTIDPTFHPTAKSTFPGTEALLVLSTGLVAAGAQLNIGGTVQSRFAIFPAYSLATPVVRAHAGSHLGRSHQG